MMLSSRWTKGSYRGIKYRSNEFVIVKSGRQTERGLHQFAKIKTVLSANNGEDLWLEVHDWETDHVDEFFNAYIVNPLQAASYVVNTKELPLHPCLSEWSDYSTDTVYLSLQYMVV